MFRPQNIKNSSKMPKIWDFSINYMYFEYKFWQFRLQIQPEARNFGRFVKKIFRPKKNAFFGRRPKFGQKFLFPAILWPFMFSLKIQKMTKFERFLTLNSSGEQKFRPFCQKFFSAKKICIFWPEAKNRPEISISGRILAICKIFEYAIFGRFFKIFDFETGRRAEISGESSKMFLADKNIYFPATNQKSARNFYFRPNSGHFKNFWIGDFRVIFQNFWLWM